MVMELSGVQFGLKPNAGFEITSMILEQKSHDVKFSYHFITSILKSQSSVAQIQEF